MGTEPLLIVGCGALATLFAARLSAAGQQVIMLGSWPAALLALNQDGARLVTSDGSEQAFPVRATADPADCSGSQMALVLVKSWQTGRAARQLSTCLAADGLAVTLQNGLGNRESLAEVLGAERVAQGVITGGATLLGPGRVRPGGEGILVLEADPRLDGLAERLGLAGFKVDRSDKVLNMLWSKLVINAAINPLTALLRLPNGALLESPEAYQVMTALAGETAAVATALGIPLQYGNAIRAVLGVAQLTAANRSSMLQDVERGAPTEIDAICGAIVQLGEQHGVPTPVNRICWQLVRALQAG